MILSEAILQYGYGRGYWLFSSPLLHLIIAIGLVWVGCSGLFSRDGKYDDRSFFEMNASYLAALLGGLVLGALAIRRMYL